MRISDALAGVQRLAIETAPYIYFVEEHPAYAEKVDAILRIAEAAGIEIRSSVISLTEILIKPIQANDQNLLSAYREMLTELEIVQLVPVTAHIAEQAAHLRARYNLRTPDALHLASALSSRCDAFLTNDMNLKRVDGLQILILDELDLDSSEID